MSVDMPNPSNLDKRPREDTVPLGWENVSEISGKNFPNISPSVSSPEVVSIVSDTPAMWFTKIASLVPSLVWPGWSHKNPIEFNLSGAVFSVDLYATYPKAVIPSFWKTHIDSIAKATKELAFDIVSVAGKLMVLHSRKISHTPFGPFTVKDPSASRTNVRCCSEEDKRALCAEIAEANSQYIDKVNDAALRTYASTLARLLSPATLRKTLEETMNPLRDAICQTMAQTSSLLIDHTSILSALALGLQNLRKFEELCATKWKLDCDAHLLKATKKAALQQLKLDAIDDLLDTTSQQAQKDKALDLQSFVVNLVQETLQSQKNPPQGTSSSPKNKRAKGRGRPPPPPPTKVAPPARNKAQAISKRPTAGKRPTKSKRPTQSKRPTKGPPPPPPSKGGKRIQ